MRRQHHNQVIHDACERLGWEEVYGQHVTWTSPPNDRGERQCACPFPGSADDTPSMRININTGAWRCWHCERQLDVPIVGGYYVQFRQRLDSSEFDDHGRLVPLDYHQTARGLIIELGIANPLSRDWVQQAADDLRHDLATWHFLNQVKPWSPVIAHELQVGLDRERERIVFPCYDSIGMLINARLYAPGGTPKTYWAVRGLTGNFLWPHRAWNDHWLILVEGEGDALTLRTFGFPGASGTVGSERPVPEGYWYQNKSVYLWMDIDDAGRHATQTAIRHLRGAAGSLYVIRMPDWPNRPDNADVSDFVVYLQSQGHSEVEVQRAIQTCIDEAEFVQPPSAVFDTESAHVAFIDLHDPDTVGQRLRWTCRVTAKTDSTYLLPTRFEMRCPAEGHTYCQRCPMLQQFAGHGTFDHDPRDPRSLKLINATDAGRIAAFKSIVGVPMSCPDPTAEAVEYVTVQPVVLNAATEVAEQADEDEAADYHRKEAMVILRHGQRIQENAEYVMEGFVYPSPKTQEAEILVDLAEQQGTVIDNFELTPEVVEQLKPFRPRAGQGVLEKLVDVAQDLAATVTLIRGRDILHLAYRSVWHSVIEFQFGDEAVQRGWLECLVLGDTGCGKSQAFQKMADYYGIGLLIDCKNQTKAGILGAAVQSGMTNEWYVIPGVYPQQDRKMVCLDEFHTRIQGEGGDVISMMASTRSEGVVTISKAATAKFRARVRSLWLANPGRGKLLAELGAFGCEWILRLIKQPEDVRRFDFAMIVAQGDVPVELLERPAERRAPRYDRIAAQQLLLWAHSRKADQVYFAPNVVDYVYQLASWMVARYYEKIPIVERNDQRKRIAKLAVSVAAQCFSTDDDCERIIVDIEHVWAAVEIMRQCYDANAMGYDRWSEQSRARNSISDLDKVRHLFLQELKPHGVAVAQQLLSLTEFTEQTFKQVVPSQSPMMAMGLLQDLILARFVQPTDGGRRNTYELTQAATQFLQQFVEEAK